jgi:ribosomal protein L37AE/L43A
MLHCANCDAIFEAHDDAHVDTTCPRCGRVVRAGATISSIPKHTDRDEAVAPDDGGHFLFTDESRRGGFSLAGQPGILRWTKNVAVRLVNSVCPACGHTTRKGMSTCPHCGRSLKNGSPPVSGELGQLLRKVLLAAAVFIGAPAAVIVFVLVVCAPEESDVPPNAQPSAPAGPIQERAKQGNATRAVPKRSPLSRLQALRKWLHGAQPGTGSSPAKVPSGKTGDEPEKSHGPAVGARNGDLVQPDPTR